MEYDFSGWATKNDLLCSDGRIIRHGAFKDNDGETVPLVWNHDHNDPYNVLGHALLENRDDGVYAYCTLNDTENGQNAKLLVQHGDISALSIYANKLKQQGPNVLHGSIKEVSLVLAGANPGASIDSVMVHGEESEDEAIIYTGEDIDLSHGEIDERSEEESMDENEMAHADEPDKEKKVANEETKQTESDETVGDVLDTLNEKQMNVVAYLVGMAMDQGDDKSDQEDNQGGSEVKHNVFDSENDYMASEDVLSHSEQQAIISDAKRYGSMREAALAHGIDDVDYLFPEPKTLNTPPEFISREMGWVTDVMNAIHHTPFSRIKSMFADITGDQARARGYIKGNMKKEEVFSLLKRTTTPTTIYKKQKMDRDDVVDITDFDVIAWLKSEMRTMLDEEIARAILVGDGRLASDDDKINEQNIRPIWTDADLYTIKAVVDGDTVSTVDERAKEFIRAAIKSRKDYKGSGNPVLFTTEDFLTDCLLLEDKIGHTLYDSVDQLATKLRVRKIVTVPVMEGLTREGSGDQTGKNLELMGIIVNLTDYNVGADKGGAINMFEDFDIDYNQQKYLIETRCSGALIKPYSAIAIELQTTAD